MDLGKNNMSQQQIMTTGGRAEEKPNQLFNQTGKPDIHSNMHGLSTPMGVKPMSQTFLNQQKQQYPKNKLFLDPRGNLHSEKDLGGAHALGKLLMDNHDSRQKVEFHKGKSGDQSSFNNSVMNQSDAFTYNGFGAATPGRNEKSSASIYNEGQ